MQKKKDFLITLYSFMAVIFVLIPEWIAEYGINIDYDQFKNTLPSKKKFNRNNPHLIIYGKDLRELRKIARKLKIIGYASDNKKSLYVRILRKLKAKI